MRLAAGGARACVFAPDSAGAVPLSGFLSVRSAAGLPVVVELALGLRARIQVVAGGDIADDPLQVLPNFLERIRSLSDGGTKNLQQLAGDIG